MPEAQTKEQADEKLVPIDTSGDAVDVESVSYTHLTLPTTPYV